MAIYRVERTRDYYHWFGIDVWSGQNADRSKANPKERVQYLAERIGAITDRAAG